jgi:segregation and condensation protein B
MTDPTPTTSIHPEPGAPPARAGDPEDPGIRVANPQPELEVSPEGPSSGLASAPAPAQSDPSQPVPSDSAPPVPPAPGPGSSAPPSASAPESAPSTSPAPGLEGDPTAWPSDEAFEAVELDDRGWTRRDLEAILLVADEPVPAQVLAEIVGSRLSEVEELLVDLAGEYARDGRGFVLR